MNFKEALIAHLQGEKVECRERSQPNGGWKKFRDEFQSVCVAHVLRDSIGSTMEFRLKPRTITVNGREVQAGEAVAPPSGSNYWFPFFSEKDLVDWYQWVGDEVDANILKNGCVHLTKEAAIAHAKAMLNID